MLFRSVAGAVGVSMLAALFDRAMAHELALHLAGTPPQSLFGVALSKVFWTVAGVSLLAGCAAWAMPATLARRSGGGAASAAPARA